jgi:hypothetical protein
MNAMFWNISFDGDISGWNVSSVTNMEAMFINTPFNGDISKCKRSQEELKVRSQSVD